MGGKGVSAILEEEGFYAGRIQDSEGPYDVIGSPKPHALPVTRWIQSKSHSPIAYRPSTVTEAIDELLKHETKYSVHREVWLWIDGFEWVVRVGVFQHALFLYNYLGGDNKWLTSIHTAATKKYPEMYIEIIEGKQDWTDYTRRS